MQRQQNLYRSHCVWSRVCLEELPEEFWKQPTGKWSVNLSHLTAHTQQEEAAFPSFHSWPFCWDWPWSTESCVQAGLHWHKLPSALLTVAPGKEARLTGSWPSARSPLCTNTIHNRKRDASWPRSSCVWKTDFYDEVLPWGRGWGLRRTLEQSKGKDALSLLSFTVSELEPVQIKTENTTGVLHRTKYNLGYVDARNPKQPTVKKERRW